MDDKKKKDNLDSNGGITPENLKNLRKAEDNQSSKESITPETLKNLRRTEGNSSSTESITPETLKNLRKSDEYANREYGEIPTTVPQVNEEDANIEEETPDVYYEDLMETQQEEIDAAEAARLEKEEKKAAAKEKAKKQAKIRDKYNKEQALIKERERLDREASQRAAEESKRREEDIHKEETSTFEEQKRQYMDEDIEREAEARKAAQQAYREEVKQATTERREKAENFQSFGKEGIDFSGREQHSAHKEEVEETKSSNEPVYNDSDKKESTYKEEKKPENFSKEDKPGFIPVEPRKEELHSEPVKSESGYKEPEYTQQHLNEKFEQEHREAYKETSYKEPKYEDSKAEDTYKSKEPHYTDETKTYKEEIHHEPVITPSVKEGDKEHYRHNDSYKDEGSTYREEHTTYDSHKDESSYKDKPVNNEIKPEPSFKEEKSTGFVPPIVDRKEEPITHREESSIHDSEYSKSHKEELFEHEHKEMHKTEVSRENPSVGDMVIDKPQTPIRDEEPSWKEPIHKPEYKEPIKETPYKEPEKEKTTHTEYRDNEVVTNETKDYGSHKEETTIHHEKESVKDNIHRNDEPRYEGKSVFEERNRQYMEEDQAKKEAAHKEKVEAYREEIKEAAAERQAKVDNYKSIGQEGIDFSGKENHVSYKEESSAPRTEETIKKEEKPSNKSYREDTYQPEKNIEPKHKDNHSIQEEKHDVERVHTDTGRESINDDYSRSHMEERMDQVINDKKEHSTHSDRMSDTVKDDIPTSKPEPITHVDTNMGRIPIEDYREIKAQQHGFDSYDDMYNQGYRLGNGYDKEPSHTVEQPKHVNDIRDTEYSRQHLNEKFEQEHSVSGNKDNHREDVKTTHHDEPVKETKNSDVSRDNKGTPGVLHADKETSHTTKQNAEHFEDNQYSRSHMNERAEQHEQAKEPLKHHIHDDKVSDTPKTHKDEKTQGSVPVGGTHKQNEPEYSREHLNERMEQHINASHKDTMKETRDFGNKNPEHHDNKSNETHTGNKDSRVVGGKTPNTHEQGEYSRQHIEEKAEQHRDAVKKASEGPKVQQNNDYSRNHVNERMDQIMADKKSGTSKAKETKSTSDLGNKASAGAAIHTAANAKNTGARPNGQPLTNDFSRSHLEERMEQHINASKAKAGKPQDFKGIKNNVLNTKDINHGDKYTGPVHKFSSYTPTGVAVTSIHTINNREYGNLYTQNVLAKSGKVAPSSRIMRDGHSFNGIENNVQKVRMTGTSNVSLVQRDGKSLMRLENAQVLKGTTKYVPTKNDNIRPEPDFRKVAKGTTFTSRKLNPNSTKETHVKGAKDIKERDIRLAHAARLGLPLSSGAVNIGKKIGNTIYMTVQYGDYDGLNTATKTKRAISTTYNSVYAVRGTFRKISGVGHAASHTMTRLGNAGRYVRGIDVGRVEEEIKALKSIYGPLSLDQTTRLNHLLSVQKKSQMRNFRPANMKEYNQQMRAFGALGNKTRWQIKREIAELKKLKSLTPDQQKKLESLTRLLKLKDTGGAIRKDMRAGNRLMDSFNSILRTAFRENDSAGIDGILAATDFFSKRYVRTTMKASLKISYVTTRYLGRKTIGYATRIGKATGIPQAVVNSRFGNAVGSASSAVYRGARNAVHGGAYNAVKKSANVGFEALGRGTIKGYNVVSRKTGFDKTRAGKAINNTASKAPTLVKTAVNKGKVTSLKAKSVLDKFKDNKVTRGIKKGFNILSAPFKAFKEVGLAIKAGAAALKKYILIGLGAILLLIVLITLLAAGLGAISSVFMTDEPNIQEYATYLSGLENNYLEYVEETIAEKMEEADSLHEATYVYTHKQSLSNIKEILSMAAVWGQQEWPEWYQMSGNFALKDYIEDLFNNSHYTRYTYSAVYECYPGCHTRRVSYSHAGGCRTDAETGDSYCPGHTRTEYYCTGHQDVTVYITCLGFDEIFNYDPNKDPDPDRGWAGWWTTDENGYAVDTGNMEWAKNLYNQDWAALYGINLNEQEFVSSPMLDEDLQEIMDKIDSQYPNLSAERRSIVTNALSLVGRVPYFWGGGHGAVYQGFDPAWGVEMRVIGVDGYSRQPKGSYQVWGLDCSGFTRWAVYNGIGSDTMNQTAGGQRRLYGTAISRSQLQPGDFANTSDDGHVGIYLYTDSVGRMVFVHCSPSVNGVGVNAPGYFTQFYTPRGVD